MSISSEMVKELRDKTGAGVMDCKKALEAAGGDMHKAVDELRKRGDVPARVVLNEYIEVANAFFEGDEPKVVNGVLDKLAHRLRPAEF